MTRAKEMRDLPLGLDVDSSGNVGIGKTPTNSSGYTTLDLHNATNGAIFNFTGSSVQGRIFADDSGGTIGFRSVSDTPIAFTMDTTEAMRIDSNGKVGIGINPSTLPSFINQAFKVSNGGGLSITSDNLADNRYIFFGHGTSSSDIQQAAIKQTNTDLVFMAATVERLKVNTSGIDVSGSITADNQVKVLGSNASSVAFSVGDAGTGFYNSGSNSIALSSNGTPSIWVTSGGNVSIGGGITDYKLRIRSLTGSGGGKVLIQTDGAFASTDEAMLDFRHYDDSGDPAGRISFKGTSNYTGDMLFKVRQGGTSGAGGALLQEKMRITNLGNVGIGTTTPYKKLTISSAFGGSALDLLDLQSSNAGGGTAPKIRFGTWANNSNTIGRIGFVDNPNYGGDFVVETNSTGGATDSTTEKFRIDKDGIVTLTNGQTLNSTGATIQTVVNQPTIYTSANPVNVWSEVNSNFRVSITPRFSSGTMILGTYSVPINPTGASNILMAIQPWYSTDGGTTKTMLNQGGPSGSRLTGSQAWFRSSNGFDVNDMQNHVVHFGYTHSATTTLTWGFYFRSEGSNTTYFCYSNGNSSLWGWTAPIYMELREIMT